VDAYRLDKRSAFGLEDEMGDDTITMIEWPEKLNALPYANQTIHLSIRLIDDQSRSIEMELVRR
jgi:tRNA A37 threonylcarbamoyladenosine biosynthesis protein TsaE